MWDLEDEDDYYQEDNNIWPWGSCESCGGNLGVGGECLNMCYSDDSEDSE